MVDYKTFCDGKEILAVSVNNQHISAIDTIHIELGGFDYLELYAEADCCSTSWFHFFDDTINPSAKENTMETFCKGKIIDSINFLVDIELPPSNIQESDINHLVCITFVDKSRYDFVLRNSSNGYYDGWIQININNSIFPGQQIN